ncbi:hypothetical protein ISN45_At01g014290 [Arabidopsis thaliana x Arabidopsis arenosa]|uniref:Uncharacterized protein n=2 Tax=Arabidopsis TaxID=3701 RepID=A0A8T2CHA0_ARASU|nr:hypothetical protein ISN44_As06g014060 [Arabidopsis suecica]KAG7646268.1 hypothetical protein ISN45_At01g014290 [Arabidopsis thaliana x Arabidopsis arenosa]
MYISWLYLRFSCAMCVSPLTAQCSRPTGERLPSTWVFIVSTFAV